MYESADLDRIAREVREVAGNCGALVVEALPIFSKENTPLAFIDVNNFAAFLMHTRPKIVYVVTTQFDASDEFLVAASEDEIDPELLNRPLIKDLVAKWCDKNDATCQVHLAFMCEGIFHVASERVSWLNDFENDVESKKERINDIRGEIDRQIEREANKQLAPMVRELMSDPRFSGSKVGVAKRTVLAESLFPNLPRHTIREIVEQAENEHFLSMSN